MRHAPVGIDRIAREPAAEMIVKPALDHPQQCDRHGFQRLVVAVAHSITPYGLQLRHGGILGSRPEPTRQGVHPPQQRACGRIDPGRRDLGRHGCSGQTAQHGACIKRHPLPVPGPRVGGSPQHLAKGRHAQFPFGRKIDAAEIGRTVGRKEDIEWPAADPFHLGHGALIGIVQIGPFFSVDQNRHEQPVDHGGGLGVSEAFRLHHMAPMAGRIADRQEDRLAGPSRACQRSSAPLLPVHRIVLVLLQIGARRPVQRIARGHFGPHQGGCEGKPNRRDQYLKIGSTHRIELEHGTRCA